MYVLMYVCVEVSYSQIERTLPLSFPSFYTYITPFASELVNWPVCPSESIFPFKIRRFENYAQKLKRERTGTSPLRVFVRPTQTQTALHTYYIHTYSAVCYSRMKRKSPLSLIHFRCKSLSTTGCMNIHGLQYIYIYMFVCIAIACPRQKG